MVNGKTNAPSVPLTTFPLLSLLTDVSSATSHPFLCSRPSPTPSPSHSEAGTGLKLIQHKPFSPFSWVFAPEFKHPGTENLYPFQFQQHTQEV